MKIAVSRESGNAGDVLVSLDGGEPFHIPGDVTSFTALRMLGPWLEEQLAQGNLEKGGNERRAVSRER